MSMQRSRTWRACLSWVPTTRGNPACTSVSICVQGLNKFLTFSDQNFSLVIVLSLFLIFGQVLIKFVLIKKSKRVS